MQCVSGAGSGDGGKRVSIRSVGVLGYEAEARGVAMGRKPLRTFPLQSFSYGSLRSMQRSPADDQSQSRVHRLAQ